MHLSAAAGEYSLANEAQSSHLYTLWAVHTYAAPVQTRVLRAQRSNAQRRVCVNAAIEIHSVTISHAATHSASVAGDSNAQLYLRSAQRSDAQRMCERPLNMTGIHVLKSVPATRFFALHESVHETSSRSVQPLCTVHPTHRRTYYDATCDTCMHLQSASTHHVRVMWPKYLFNREKMTV